MNDSSEPASSLSRLVVIGASAGGVHALRTLASLLAPDLPMAVLVVLHIGSHPSVLPDLLATAGPLPAAHAEDGQRLLPGRIYIAPPDCHLLVEEQTLRLSRGPKEHHSRPAVDPLFRSAALTYGSRVIGVVLTGHLDDGTAGLQAIKACGGLAVVQDPAQAREPSMPRSALRHVAVDHCLSIEGIARLLTRLADEPLPTASTTPAAPPALAHEHTLSRSAPSGAAMEHLQNFAEPSSLVCPDCGGALWEVKDAKPLRYRCHTGHGYTMRTLAHAMHESTEAALASAVRALEEEGILLRRAAALSRASGALEEAAALTAGAEKADVQARTLRSMAEDPVIQPLEKDLASGT